jgi:hypothetical protein
VDTITIATEPSRFPKQRKPKRTLAIETAKMKSRRPTKTGRRSPAQSEAQKKLWRDPEHRRKMIAARHRSTEDRRKDPLKYSRLGVPTGMRKAEAMALWETAGEIADRIIGTLEADGTLPEVVIPESDDDVAKACIRELAIIAFGPGKDMRVKLMALYALLKYTKGKPTRHVDYTLTPEEWLRQSTRGDCSALALRDSTHKTTDQND